MATLVLHGDRLLTLSGRESALKRPSVPLAQFGRGAIPLTGAGGIPRLLSYLTAYETQPWIAAAVNKLNRSIMYLPIRLYREVADDGEVEPVYQHPLMDLLLHPWERGSPAQLKQKMSFPALIHGNGVLGKVRPEPNAPPTELVPLDWRFLTAWALDDGEIFFWETAQPNREQFWAPENVVHFAFDAGNGDIGCSPLKQLAVTVESEDAAQRYQGSSFNKGVRPSGALIAPEKVSDERLQRVREAVKAAGEGVDKAGSLMLLGGGLDFKAFAHTAVEAELIQQRKLNREEAAAVYDVAPPLIGILDHATYSNIEELNHQFYRDTLRPWLTLITDTLNAQLISAEPRWRDDRLFYAFDLSEVLRSDTPDEITAAVAAIAGGVATPNEGRNRLRWRRSTQKGADKLYLPTNNLSPMGEEPPKPEPPLEHEPGPTSTNGTEPVDEEQVAKRHVERARRQIARKMGAGEQWDKARFVRELYHDAPGVDGFTLAALLENAITAADGSPSKFSRLASQIQ